MKMALRTLLFPKPMRLALTVGIVVVMGGGQTWAAPTDCRVYPLHSGIDNRPVIGPEALAVDRDSAFLFISAFDRQGGGESAPPGVYGLPRAALDRFWENQPPEPVTRLTDDTVGEPMGLASYATHDRQTVFVIDRSPKLGAAPLLRRFEWSGTSLKPKDQFAIHKVCHPNGIAATDHDHVFVSSDHGCGWYDRAILGDVFALPKAYVVSVQLPPAGTKAEGISSPDITGVAGGFVFANGLAFDAHASVLHVADTRRNQILSLSIGKDSGLSIGKDSGLSIGKDSGLSIGKDSGGTDGGWPNRYKRLPLSVITELAFAPDNLALDRDGTVLAAGHTATFPLFLHFRGLRPADGLRGSVARIDTGQGPFAADTSEARPQIKEGWRNEEGFWISPAASVTPVSEVDEVLLTAPTTILPFGPYFVVGSVAAPSLTICRRSGDE